MVLVQAIGQSNQLQLPPKEHYPGQEVLFLNICHMQIAQYDINNFDDEKNIG